MPNIGKTLVETIPNKEWTGRKNGETDDDVRKRRKKEVADENEKALTLNEERDFDKQISSGKMSVAEAAARQAALSYRQWRRKRG